ncbi:PadR family transcriptional regulator [Frondihabitans sp. PhB188]|uniref:PadR family transcriptional regulator n=1 Tax=Frondihabitans sp. PhB188 TaxID=2485200 RepID=UPI000F496B9F|nr:PadR family transcriptional regulator [Frondihabitans sp. PhB188]ROQ39475.1 PadR family transcriptional regulator [Frondihabitans sp. PhB188]
MNTHDFFEKDTTRTHHERPEFGPFRGRGRGFGPGMGGFGAAAGAMGPGFPFGGPGMGFGPGRGGRGRARKGDVRLAILSLLGDAPANGYGLMKSIAERTEGAWRPSPGSVYPTLQQLVDEGLIAVTGEGRQSMYQLTDEGTAYVAEHGDEIAKAWGEATEADPRHDEFIGSAIKLAGVIKQFAFDATPEQRSAGKDKLDELRRALYSILAD